MRAQARQGRWIERGVALAALACVQAQGVTGCGGPPPPAGPATFYQFATAATRPFCEWAARCGVLASSEVASCAAVGLLPPKPYDPQVAVMQGRLGYDPAEAQKCLDAIPTTACLDFRALEQQCWARPFSGKVAAGGACQADLECMAGACTASSDGCMGQCAAFLAPGAGCRRDAQCGPPGTARCAPSSSGGGGACQSLGVAGSACSANGDCQIGLVCLTGYGQSTGTCAAPGSANQSCSVDTTGLETCGDGLYCLASLFASSGASTGSCEPKVAAAGAPCYGWDGCADGMTCKGYGVVLNGFVPMAQPGTCAGWLDSASACPTASGNQLFVWSGCPYDSVCDASSNQCDVPGQAGSPCVGGRCQAGADCADGTTCAAQASFGQSCGPTASGANPCVQGACDPSTHLCALVCM